MRCKRQSTSLSTSWSSTLIKEPFVGTAKPLSRPMIVRWMNLLVCLSAFLTCEISGLSALACSFFGSAYQASTFASMLVPRACASALTAAVGRGGKTCANTLVRSTGQRSAAEGGAPGLSKSKSSLISSFGIPYSCEATSRITRAESAVQIQRRVWPLRGGGCL